MAGPRKTRVPMVEQVQTAIDPVQNQGQGLGIAPIGLTFHSDRGAQYTSATLTIFETTVAIATPDTQGGRQ